MPDVEGGILPPEQSVRSHVASKLFKLLFRHLVRSAGLYVRQGCLTLHGCAHHHARSPTIPLPNIPLPILEKAEECSAGE
jgi:hypothetical protein